jgi:hypothetical protein
VLKKAGIVVAAAAAGMLAMSPLAFAGDSGHDGDPHHGHVYVVKHGDDNSYHVDNSIDRDQHNHCYFSQNESSVGDSTGTGVVPLLGALAQTGNCTNVGDVTVANLGTPPPPA